MSQLTQWFHLICAIVASITCIVFSVGTVLLVFVWHKLRPDVRLLIGPLVLAFGAAMAFKFYKSSANEQDD
jgi:hypothetical protein